MDPKSARGAFSIAMIGFFGALTALLVAQFVPSIIPARATSVKL